MKKILTVMGTRPQFIKVAALSRELRKYHNEILVDTGQHYDHNLSKIFVDELDVPKPDYNLKVGSLTHGQQIGNLLPKIEDIILVEKPDAILLYGDTNSTLAGAIVASRFTIPIFHIEAGTRNYSASIEEKNRMVVDVLSTLLFCNTQLSQDNLKKENALGKSFNVGDIMLDIALFNEKKAQEKSTILKQLNLSSKQYILATLHRDTNTKDSNKLRNIIEAFNESNKQIVFVIHPRTKKAIEENNIKLGSNIKQVEPLGYLDILMLLINAQKVITDSGGLQREAYFFDIPCILTYIGSWPEIISDKYAVVAEDNKEKILDYIHNFKLPSVKKINHFGDGSAVQKIIAIINDYFNNKI